VPNIPVYFIIPPRSGVSFRVLVRPVKTDPGYVNGRDARLAGFDWDEFAAWRVRSLHADYYRWSMEYGVRCLNIQHRPEECAWIIDGVSCPYSDYVCREHSVNFSSIGVIPDLRRLLEGEPWDRGQLDLDDCAASASRFSMRISITSLVLTSDDYFVFQRRSDAVAAGTGNLAGAGNGAADWFSDYEGFYHSRVVRPLDRGYLLPQRLAEVLRRCGPAPKDPWRLRNSALREIAEEIGVSRFRHSDHAEDGVPAFERPFIGAALNLRHGRDLNFYCCFRSELEASDIAAQREVARDSWEVASLVFINKRDVTLDRLVSGALDGLLPNRTRHLNALLYAWAVFAASTEKNNGC
jgi:hypothetical protein